MTKDDQQATILLSTLCLAFAGFYSVEEGNYPATILIMTTLLINLVHLTAITAIKSKDK